MMVITVIVIITMMSMAKVNSLYGDVSRDGLWATGVLLLGAGGDADKHQPFDHSLYIRSFKYILTKDYKSQFRLSVPRQGGRIALDGEDCKSPRQGQYF